MNKEFLFFLFATLITALTVITFNTGPIINGKIGSNWKTLNCLLYSDRYKQNKEDLPEDTDELKEKKDKALKRLKKTRDSCYREKAFYGLEYSSFTINLVIGFICSLLGLLHYLNEGKTFSSKTGLIGLISGSISFIITLIYVIYSALVYSKDYSSVYKTDEKGIFATWDSSSNTYHCSFYNDEDSKANYAKFSELSKKQYNYNKDNYISYYSNEYGKHPENFKCSDDVYYYASRCSSSESFTIGSITNPKEYTDENGNTKQCLNLYNNPIKTNENKDIADRWLTTLIVSIIIILCNIGLAIFGFLLFKNKEDSNQVPIS